VLGLYVVRRFNVLQHLWMGSRDRTSQAGFVYKKLVTLERRHCQNMFWLSTALPSHFFGGEAGGGFFPDALGFAGVATA
jgi:hypothetical protein